MTTAATLATAAPGAVPRGAAASGAIDRIVGARLPAWALPGDWPRRQGRPVPADLRLADGRIASVAPRASDAASGTAVPAGVGAERVLDVGGAPVLPGLVDAHTHLDKAFTLHRVGEVGPGLLAAIEAMRADREHWTAADVRERAGRALAWAFDAGVVRLRTHVDWWEPEGTPLAWGVLRELAADWAGRVDVDRVSLVPLTLFATRDDARALARRVAAGGPGAVLGAFVHTTHWDPVALRHLLEAAEDAGLDVDLHVDEELAPQAQGVDATARIAREIRFSGRIACSHACALAAQPDAQALATLDAVARAPITIVSMPITNLLLQDAVTGRTPRTRGLTLLKEARARDIPLLVASDNVQDPFCPVGSFDPVEALAAGVLAGQLGAPFDDWSDTLCRADRLSRDAAASPLAAGAPADLVIFDAADAIGWPSRAHPRTVLRAGVPIGSAAAARADVVIGPATEGTR